MLVLIVDDDPLSLGTMAAVLLQAGHRVVESGNGAEARELLAEIAFDVLVTDIFMPGVDGIELLRHAATLRRVPRVLLISGGTERISLASLDLLSFGLALGADAVLQKPFLPQDLILKVGELGASCRHADN